MAEHICNQQHVVTLDYEQVYGVILAGGMSRRMGQDKAQLQYAGKSLLHHATQQLHQLGLGKVVVSGSKIPGAVPDVVAHKGPLGAIYSVLSQVEIRDYQYLLCSAVDMPNLPSKTLQTLVNASMADGQSHYYENHPLPCCIKVQPDHLEVARRQIEQNRDMSLRHFFESIDCRPLTATCDQGAFFNANNPQQWQQFMLSKQ